MFEHKLINFTITNVHGTSLLGVDDRRNAENLVELAANQLVSPRELSNSSQLLCGKGNGNGKTTNLKTGGRASQNV